MKTKKVIKCWGVPYGKIINKEQTEEITIEMQCATIKEFKEECEKEGHRLSGNPYLSK